MANNTIHLALENLEKHTHITGVWENNATWNDSSTTGKINFNINNKNYKIFFIVKNGLRMHQLHNIEMLAATQKPFLLIAEHILPKIKDRLRENNIGYLETNGNIYIQEPGLFLWIDTLKPLQDNKEKINRAFTKTGLKVIFHFLLNEDLVNCPYREIAKVAGVSLGNINSVMNGLKDAHFLIKLTKKEYKLHQKRELLEKWMVAYAERLKTTLQTGTFRFLKEEDFNKWKDMQLTPGKTYWGGEPGGDKFTNYLNPEILTLYTTEGRAELMKNYRLVPDDNGNVKVFKKFWSGYEVKQDIAPPLLVYGDLMNTGDSRCIETAQRIYDELLQDKF